jgi:hypothetical protein
MTWLEVSAARRGEDRERRSACKGERRADLAATGAQMMGIICCLYLCRTPGQARDGLSKASGQRTLMRCFSALPERSDAGCLRCRMGCSLARGRSLPVISPRVLCAREYDLRLVRASAPAYSASRLMRAQLIADL